MDYDAWGRRGWTVGSGIHGREWPLVLLLLAIGQVNHPYRRLVSDDDFFFFLDGISDDFWAGCLLFVLATERETHSFIVS